MQGQGPQPRKGRCADTGWATRLGVGRSGVEGVGAEVGERAQHPLGQQRVGVVEQLGEQVDRARRAHVLAQLPRLLSRESVHKGGEVQRAARPQLWVLRGATGRAGGGERGAACARRVPQSVTNSCTSEESAVKISGRL